MIRIQIFSVHNDTICNKQRRRKCQNTNLSSDQTSWDTNHATAIQFQNTLQKTTYVITRNVNITMTRLVFILLRFHAVSVRLLLNPWHRNDPEQKIHLFLLESKPQFSNDFVRQLPGMYAPRGTNAKNRTRDRRLGVVWIRTETVDWLMLLLFLRKK